MSLTNTSTYSHSLNLFVAPTSSDNTILLLTINSSSPLDPIPIKLFHDIASEIAQPLNGIFTKSLNSGIVPSIYKYAIITLIFKKTNLDPNIFNKYRPESIVAKLLIHYLTTNNLLHPFQSAYMPKKCTETSLTNIF